MTAEGVASSSAPTASCGVLSTKLEAIPIVEYNLRGRSARRLLSVVPKISDLDRSWQELMFLCSKEEEYARDAIHPKLLAHIRRQIGKLAADMGFTPAQIRSRQFRAERDGQHILRILTDD